MTQSNYRIPEGIDAPTPAPQSPRAPRYELTVSPGVQVQMPFGPSSLVAHPFNLVLNYTQLGQDEAGAATVGLREGRIVRRGATEVRTMDQEIAAAHARGHLSRTIDGYVAAEMRTVLPADYATPIPVPGFAGQQNYLKASGIIYVQK